MILPIIAYGSPVLKKRAVEIKSDYPNLQQLIQDMFDTMYAAKGVGLAAPQVDASIRLLIIDATIYSDEFPETIDFKKDVSQQLRRLKWMAGCNHSIMSQQRSSVC